MCLAIPMKITKIDGLTATGEAGGILQDIRIDFLEDVKSGDYVMVHAGFAIEQLSEQQARENLACIQEALDALE